MKHVRNSIQRYIGEKHGISVSVFKLHKYEGVTHSSLWRLKLTYLITRWSTYVYTQDRLDKSHYATRTLTQNRF